MKCVGTFWNTMYKCHAIVLCTFICENGLTDQLNYPSWLREYILTRGNLMDRSLENISLTDRSDNSKPHLPLQLFYLFLSFFFSTRLPCTNILAIFYQKSFKKVVKNVGQCPQWWRAKWMFVSNWIYCLSINCRREIIQDEK